MENYIIRLIPICPKYNLTVLNSTIFSFNLEIKTSSPTYISFSNIGYHYEGEIFESNNANCMCLKVIANFMNEIKDKVLSNSIVTTEQHFIAKQYKYLITTERMLDRLITIIYCILNMDIEEDLTQFLELSKNKQIRIEDFIFCNKIPDDLEYDSLYPKIKLVDYIEYKN